jgi:hypothetical protein
VDGPAEMMTYTQCLKEDGTMEADITVSKGHDNQYTVIATDTAHRHVETLLRRGLDPEANKHVTVTGMFILPMLLSFYSLTRLYFGVCCTFQTCVLK